MALIGTSGQVFIEYYCACAGVTSLFPSFSSELAFCIIFKRGTCLIWYLCTSIFAPFI